MWLMYKHSLGAKWWLNGCERSRKGDLNLNRARPLLDAPEIQDRESNVHIYRVVKKVAFYSPDPIIYNIVAACPARYLVTRDVWSARADGSVKVNVRHHTMMPSPTGDRGHPG